MLEIVIDNVDNREAVDLSFVTLPLGCGWDNGGLNICGFDVLSILGGEFFLFTW